MKLFLALVLSACMLVTLAACDSVFFIGGTLNPGTSSITGTISIVQISAVIGDDGSTVQVTFVTFLNSGSSSTVGFCGDERDRFPMQQTVRASFIPGRTCDSIVTIVIT